MRRHAFLLVALLVAAGCQPAATPPAKPAVGPALAPRDDHAGHDHAGHDHSDHDHATPAQTGHDMPPGGAEAEGHEGHHHPETLAALVAELVGLVDKTRGAIEAGDRDTGDATVHEFGHLVEDVEALATEAKLPEAAREAVVKAGNDLFDAFDALDHAYHDGGDVAEAWKGKAAAIEAALRTLKDAVAE